MYCPECQLELENPQTEICEHCGERFYVEWDKYHQKMQQVIGEAVMEHFTVNDKLYFHEFCDIMEDAEIWVNRNFRI